MKKFVFFLFLLSQSSIAQKVIYLPDSTALSAYISQAGTLKQGTAMRLDTIAERRPAFSSVGVYLNKRLTANVRAVPEITALSGGANYLHYTAYVNRHGRIDSLLYYYITTDTTRARRNAFRSKVGSITDKQLRTRLESNLQAVITDFSGDQTVRRHSGNIYLAFRTKNLHEYLSTKADDITEINLTDFGLREFPAELKRFKKLKTINLKDNYIGSAVIDGRDFPNLTNLSFQNNLLTDNSLQLRGRLRPATINLTENHFTRLPKTHRKVKHLFLANSGISRLSAKDVRSLKKIESLNLYNNKLTVVTPRIRRLKNLKELDLYRNRLSALPAQITQLKNLEALAISYNDLTELPSKIQALENLRTLYAHHNRLYALPMLPEKLEILDVGYNKIGEVHRQIAPLKNLITLDYSHNLVKGDLDFLVHLPQIKEIYLFENRYAANEEDEKYFGRIFSVLVSKGVTVK